MEINRKQAFSAGLEGIDFTRFTADDKGIEIHAGIRNFIARIEQTDMQPGLDLRVVSFTIRTAYSSSGNRGEFFEINRASMLADRAIAYFAEDGDVQGIKFNWLHPTLALAGRSDNYEDYFEALPVTVEHWDVETMQEAARQTWTFGRVAEPNGFIMPGIVVHRPELDTRRYGREYPWHDPMRVQGLFLKPGVL